MVQSGHRSSTTGGGRLQQLESLYRDLHGYPECSGCEERTAAVFGAALSRRGAEVTTGVGGHGVVGMIRNGVGPTVLLRAELDALPVAEQTGLPYASTRPGVMHACGHDVHLVGVVGALEELLAARSSWSGTLLMVGQPSEETLTGASGLIADGLYERWPIPDVALAQHIAPLPAGVIAHGPDLTLASAQFRIDLRGESMHAALAAWAPHVIGAITAVTDIVQTAAHEHEALAAIGVIRCGEAPNVAPNTAYVLGSVRAPSARTVRAVLSAVDARLTTEVSVPAVVTVTGSADRVEQDAELRDDLIAEHGRAFGRSRIWTSYATNAADDFSDYGLAGPDGRRIRLGYWMFGGIEPSVWRAAADATRASGTDVDAATPSAPPIAGNHSDRFTPHRSALRVAVVAMTTAARTQLASASTPERTLP